MKSVGVFNLMLHLLVLHDTINGLVLPPGQANDPNEGRGQYNEPTLPDQGQASNQDMKQYPDVIHQQNQDELKPNHLLPPKSDTVDTSRDLYQIIRTRRAIDTSKQLSFPGDSTIKRDTKKFHSTNYFPYYPYPPTPLRQRGVDVESHAQSRSTNKAKGINQEEDHYNILQDTSGLQQALRYIGQGRDQGNGEAVQTEDLMRYTKSPEMFSSLRSSNKKSPNTRTSYFHGRKRRDVKVTLRSRDSEAQLARSRDSALKRLMASLDSSNYSKNDGFIHGYIEDVNQRPVQAPGALTLNNIVNFRRRLSKDKPWAASTDMALQNIDTKGSAATNEEGLNIELQGIENNARTVDDRRTVGGYIEDISTPTRSWSIFPQASTSSMDSGRNTLIPNLPLYAQASYFSSDRDTDVQNYLNPLNVIGSDIYSNRNLQVPVQPNPLYVTGYSSYTLPSARGGAFSESLSAAGGPFRKSLKVIRKRIQPAFTNTATVMPLMLYDIPPLSTGTGSIFSSNLYMNPFPSINTVYPRNSFSDSLNEAESFNLSPISDSDNIPSVVSSRVQVPPVDNLYDSSNTLSEFPGINNIKEPAIRQFPINFQQPTEVAFADIWRLRPSRYDNRARRMGKREGDEEQMNIQTIGGREFVRPLEWENQFVADSFETRPSFMRYPILANVNDAVDSESVNRPIISERNPSILPAGNLRDISKVKSAQRFHRIKRETAPAVLRSSHHGNSHHSNLNGHHGPAHHGGQGNQGNGVNLNGNQGDFQNGNQENTQIGTQIPEVDGFLINQGNNPDLAQTYGLAVNQGESPDMIPINHGNTPVVLPYNPLDTIPNDTPVTVKNNQGNAMGGNQGDTPDVGPYGQRITGGLDDITDTLPANLDTPLQVNQDFQTEVSVGPSTGIVGFQDYQADLPVTAGTGLQGYPDYQTMTGIQGNQDYQTDVNQGTGFFGFLDYPQEAGQIIPATGLAENQRRDVEDENNNINSRVSMGANNQDFLNLQTGSPRFQDDRKKRDVSSLVGDSFLGKLFG